MKLIGAVHTTRMVIDPVHEAITAIGSGIDVSHVLDEGILRRLATLGEITDEIVDWLTRMVGLSETGGAELAVVSCSSLSPCVDRVRPRVGIPVLRVDEPMMEYAVRQGGRIGLLMTNPTTEAPSSLLFREVAERLSSPATIVPVLCPDAFARLNRGDIEGHDRAVVETVEHLLQDVDLIMFAQISIARVKKRLDPAVSGRVLTSLDFIGEKIREVVGEV